MEKEFFTSLLNAHAIWWQRSREKAVFAMTAIGCIKIPYICMVLW